MATGLLRTDGARIKRTHTNPATLATPGRVYGYARVSTLQQSNEGESLEVQQRTIAGYAMQHGMTVERMYIERGVSGSKPLDQRPEGSELLGALKPATL